MPCIIEADGLTRRFGNLVAVDHVDFTVEQGEIFGFLGPNGAGKTTTVRMLTGIIEPSDGTAVVQGYDVALEPVRARRDCGVVPEEANVYLDLTVWQNLMLMAELHGLPRRRCQRDGERLLDILGLADRRAQKARKLSKGLRQRLMLCTALVSSPSLLFLDEPTSGLDVASARLIRDIVRQLNREGLTVFLTTHNMAEAEQMCSRVDIINEGKIVAVDTTDELRNLIKSRQLLEVAFADEHEPVGQALAGLDGVTDCIPDGGAYMLQTQEPGEVAVRVCRLAETKGWAIEAIRTRKPTLEEAFLHLTGGKGGAQRGDSQRMRGQGGGHGDRH